MTTKRRDSMNEKKRICPRCDKEFTDFPALSRQIGACQMEIRIALRTHDMPRLLENLKETAQLVKNTRLRDIPDLNCIQKIQVFFLKRRLVCLVEEVTSTFNSNTKQ